MRKFYLLIAPNASGVPISHKLITAAKFGALPILYKAAESFATALVLSYP